MSGAVPDEGIDDVRLAEFRQRLAAIRFEPPGFVETLILCPRPDQHERVSQLRVLPEAGVEGQYPGKQWWRGRRMAGRQISALNAEVLDALEIPYTVPGDNLVIRGLDLSQFEPGDVLRVGEALLVATQTPHRPCRKLAARTSLTQMTAIAAGRLRGTLFDAHRPGTVTVGDPVERILL